MTPNRCHAWCLCSCSLTASDHTGHPLTLVLRPGYGTKYDTKLGAPKLVVRVRPELSG